MVDARPPVGGRRALVEDPLGRALTAPETLGEHVVVVPAALDALFERHEVEFPVDGIERHRALEYRATFAGPPKLSNRASCRTKGWEFAVSGVTDLYSVDGDALLLSVHVQPGAGRSAVVGRHGTALKLRVAAPPLEDRANVATVALLASTLDVAERDVTLVSGGHSRLKRFRIKGAEPAELVERLERALEVAAEAPGPRGKRDRGPGRR